MYIHVLYKTMSEPWGGGNQFLKGLIKQFESRGCYVQDIENADIILFNSHQNIEKVIASARKFPEKIFIQRLDGPMVLYNDIYDRRDAVAYQLSRYLADGVIFQSVWSETRNKQNGLAIDRQYSTVIKNAADPRFFFPARDNAKPALGNIRIVISSWSNNWKKGFDYYSFLDKNLDFTRFDVTFVGNSPVKFNNFRVIPPLESDKLGELLRSSDIYVTASQNDPCSNSLVEAMSCGLPSLVLDSGGHPELISSGGLVFRGKSDLIQKLELLKDDLESYRASIEVLDIVTTVNHYLEFMENVTKRNECRRQSLARLGKLWLSIKVLSGQERVLRIIKKESRAFG